MYSVGVESPLLIFGFFLLSTIVNKFVMSPIALLVFKQEAKEGDFRLVVLSPNDIIHSILLDSIMFKSGTRLNHLPFTGWSSL